MEQRGRLPQRHVAVVFVHGILAKNDAFADPMEKRLRKLLPKELQPFVHFRSVYWAGPVRDHQDDYQVRMYSEGLIWHRRLRRLVIEGLGDAAAYQKTRRRENSIYYQAQDAISNKLKSLYAQLKSDCPLIFVGHSLGCHVISSYLWDLNKLKQRGSDDIKTESDPEVRALWKELQDASDFCRLDTCAGIVTLGSNMPMFTFTFGPTEVYPITSGPKDPDGNELKPAFPGATLPPALKEKARWLNFYSTWDILGFPLKSLNDRYSRSDKITDIRVWSGAPWYIPYVWCIFSHMRYWTNRVVVRETLKLIEDMMLTPADAQRPPAGTAVPAQAPTI